MDFKAYFEGKRILVTGGAGCIGSNLTHALLESGASQILILDNLSSSARWNIPSDPEITVIEGDILDEEKARYAFSFKPEVVFHLAAHFANQNSVEHPETDLQVNGLGTLKTLEYSRLSDVEKFVYASSGCSVYGSEAPLPLTEDYISLHLDTPYQITKLLGELYCNYFGDMYGLPVVIDRYFNVYGPGEVPGRYRNVIPNFIFWAMRGQPLPITGSGEETRDFTYVDDIVDGTLLSASSKGAVGEAINLASSTETPVNDLAFLINQITGNEAGVTMLPRRVWDRSVRRRASISKARKLLDYNPTTDLKDGIRRTYEWIQRNFDRLTSYVL